MLLIDLLKGPRPRKNPRLPKPTPRRGQAREVFDQQPQLPLTGSFLIYRYDPAGGACIGRGRIITLEPIGTMEGDHLYVGKDPS